MSKLMVLGVFYTHGVSKKTGSPYSISKVIYGREISPVKTEARSVEGFGFEAQDMDLDPMAVMAFKDMKFPALIDCKIECQPNNPQRNWITGLSA